MQIMSFNLIWCFSTCVNVVFFLSEVIFSAQGSQSIGDRVAGVM